MNRHQRRTKIRCRALCLATCAAAALPFNSTWAAEEPTGPVPALAPSTAIDRANLQNVSLTDLSLEELMDVKVTTVTRQVSTVGESAAAIFVITPEMIKRSGAREIPELLRMVPGLEVARINSNQWAITARGFNSKVANKLLVQIDGRTVYNPIYSGVYWETIDYPLDDIERIEVIRGPGGSVWGANAVNGIINIITRPASETNGWLLGSGGGSEEQAFTTLRYGAKTKNGKGDFRIFAKAAAHDSSFNTLGNEHDRWHAGSGGFRYDMPHQNGSFTLQGDVFSTAAGQSNLSLNINNPPTFMQADTANEDAQGGNLLARWSHKTDEDHGWSLQAYYDRMQRHLLNDYAQFSIDTGDIDYQRQSTLGTRHRLVYGAGFRMQRVHFEGSGAIDGGFADAPANSVVTRNVASAFLQDETRIKPNLTMTLGTKLEHNDYSGLEYEPSARLLYAPSRKHSIWASFSRAVRTPSMLENDITLVGLLQAAGPTVFGVIAPNTNLDAESVLAHEIGYRAQLSNRLSVDATAFYNSYNNVISNDIGTTFPPGPLPGSLEILLPYSNGATANSHGFELSTNYNAGSRWKLYGAYTYLKVNLHADPNLAPGIRQNLEGAQYQTPHHQIYLRSSWDLPHHLQLDMIGRYVSRLSGFNPAVPGYTACDLRLAWQKDKNTEFSIVGQNLFASHHLEFVNGVPMEIQRGIYGKVSYHW